jgi:hypothetical protein
VTDADGYSFKKDNLILDPSGGLQFYNTSNGGLTHAARKCAQYLASQSWTVKYHRGFNIADTMMSPTLSKIQGYRSSLRWSKAEPKPIVEYIGQRKLQLHISRLSKTNGECEKLEKGREYRFHIIPKGARPLTEISPIDGTTVYTEETLAVKYPPYLAASIGKQLKFDTTYNTWEHYDPTTLCDDSRYSRGAFIGID